MKNNLGGKRPGAGRPKGSGGAESQAKALSRQFMALQVKKHLRPLVRAHIAKAIGTCKLMLRQTDGTWRAVTAEDDIERALNGDPNMYWIATNQPDTQSFNTLLAYGLDKPKEQPAEINLGLTADLAERLAAGRRYIAEHRQLEEAIVEAELVKPEPANSLAEMNIAQRAVPPDGTDQPR